MPRSLQEITDAWGDWRAKSRGTWCKWTASTNYSNQSDLKDYHRYETQTKTLDTVFGDNRGQLVDANGETIWYDNMTDSPQSNTFTYSETKAESFTWGLSETLKIGVSAKATIGVPLVAEAEVTLSTEVDLTSNQSWSKSDSKTWSDSNPVIVPVKKSVRCQIVMQVQKYDVPFTSRVQLSGCVAIWHHDKVDGHWLYFIPIGTVFSEIVNHNIISTEGYEISGGNVIAEVPGVLTGDLGVSIAVKTEQFWLRGWTPSESQVQQDLMNNLIAAAQSELKAQCPSYSGDSTSLSTAMRGLAEGRFTKDYYPLDGQHRPDDCQGPVHMVDLPMIIYTEDDMDKQISDFVSTNLLNAGDLPQWMQAACKADITTYVKTLLHGQEDNKCNAVQYAHPFPSTRQDQISMNCSTIVVYANGTLTEVAVTTRLHALYFLGVFYPTGDPVSAARGELQDAAYSTAMVLNPVSSITSDPSLEESLLQYGGGKFSGKFEYTYKGIPVDFPSGETQALLTRNEHLGTFIKRDASLLDVWVKNNIFGGLNIPITSAADSALQDVTTIYQGIFEDPQRGAWNTQYLDKIYLLGDVENVNPVAINAVFIYWCGETTAYTQKGGQPSQEPVSLTYVFFMGVVHECAPDPLTKDLYTKLCSSIPDNTDTDPTGNLTTLKKDLNNYTLAGWKAAFKFDFDPTNVIPPDFDKKYGTPKYFNLLFKWRHIPTQDEIKEQIEHIWYKRGQTTVFKHCGDEIYDDLVDQISYRAGPETVKVDFDWAQSSLISRYEYTVHQKSYTVEEYAFFTFAHGKITEDGHGGDTHEVFVLSFLTCIGMLDLAQAELDDGI